MKYFLTFGGKVVGVCTILLVAAGVVTILVLWMHERKMKKKKMPPATPKSATPNKFGVWISNSWRSLLFLAPTLGILYLVAKWSQFDGTILQFIMTQKVLGLVFGIAIATYIVTFAVLSTPDWKWYAKLSRKVSGWVVVVVSVGLILSWLGLSGTSLTNRKPVIVYNNGSISIVYKPENIKQEVNLNLLPGKKYKVVICSWLKRNTLEHGKVVTHDVSGHGLQWTLEDMESTFAQKARIDLCPLKDKRSNFAGVVANIDGYNKWLIPGKYVYGGHLQFITLNDRQEESSFGKYKGLLVVTLIPQ